MKAVRVLMLLPLGIARAASLEACHHAEQRMSLSHRCTIAYRQLQHYSCCTVTPVSMLVIDSTRWLKVIS